MPQKAKAKTGTALPDQSQPDNSDASASPTITDAQATDLQPGSSDTGMPGFTTLPSAPSMGGSATEPSEFAKQVATATRVPSKGGPPTSALYASSGKGIVGRPKSPQESGNTARPPEQKEEPEAPVMSEGAWVPAPGKEPPSTQAAPEEGTAAPLPGLSNPDRVARIQRAFSQFGIPFNPNADYSHEDPYITQDPNFAGIDPHGNPVFMGPDSRPYYRFESDAGKGVIHYFDEPAGTEFSKNGHPYEDKAKIDAAQEARDQLTNMLKTQDAIQKWRELQLAFVKNHPDGENWLQRLAVEARMSGAQGWQAAIAKALASIPGIGVTPDMEQLDAARKNMVLPYESSFAKGKEGLRIPGTQAEEGVPVANDDFGTQVNKVNAMEDQLRNSADALRTKYPWASRNVEDLLGRIRTGSSGQTRSTGNVERSTATPVGSTTTNVTREQYNQLKNGDPFYYNGQIHYKGEIPAKK